MNINEEKIEELIEKKQVLKRIELSDEEEDE